MKFILLTNPSTENNVLNELLVSGLFPDLVVTRNPFYINEPNPFKYLFKKAKILFKYVFRRSELKKTYLTYFLSKKNDIPVLDSHIVNTDSFVQVVESLSIDYIFTFGFKILKEKVINAPKSGCINFHPAYLPHNRGASPSNWVVINNQKTTGVTFHFITEKIDEGEIIEQYKVPLSGLETTKILNTYLFALGEQLLVRLIYRLKNNFKIETKFNILDTGSYQKPFRREDTILTSNLSSVEIYSIINASRENNRTAIYSYNEKEYYIINYIELIDTVNENSKIPYVDSDQNIVVSTIDKKNILLIVDKTK